MLLRRLFGLDSQDTELARLRRRVAAQDVELARRRSDDILAARVCAVPLPRPGTAQAQLLSQNRALRRHNERLQHDPEATPTHDRPLLSAASASEIDASWRRADREHVVWTAHRRVIELTGWSLPDLEELRLVADALVTSLVVDGPSLAARIIEPYQISDDGFAVGVEAVMFALAADHGPAFFGVTRAAWAAGLDALATSLGVCGTAGATVYSSTDSSDITTS